MATIAAWVFLWPLFWLAFFVVAIACTSNEKPTLAAMILVGGLAVMWFITGDNPFAWILDNKGKVIIAALAWIPIGVGWSIFQWRRFGHEKVEDDRQEWESWLRRRAEAEKEFGTLVDWERNFPMPPIEAPAVLENKYRFTNWIMWWPMSVLWFLIADVTKYIRDEILRMFGGLYARIMAGIYGNLLADIEAHKAQMEAARKTQDPPVVKPV